MAMAERSCDWFLEALASKAPVPGGGGAAALVGAIGMALSNMVGNLTVGKKKYAGVESEAQELLAQGYRILEELKALADKDAEVFEPLSKAYSLPKETIEQAEHKARVLEECSIAACSVPLAIMRLAYSGIKVSLRMGQIGNKLAISDVGCGLACLKAALISGRLNVLINLGTIHNQQFIRETMDEMNCLLDEGCRMADETLNQIIDQISPGSES
jgi:formiminotetrahydrofolate cyclodeaminase